MVYVDVKSSESVTEGHPDKVCDKVSDSILDAYLAKDPESRVACETMIKSWLTLSGEITSNAKNVDPEKIARDAIKEIGYDDEAKGFNYETARILVDLTRQSPDIAQGVNEGQGDFKEQGAGDQGMMYGFASNETPELMPLPIILAHKLTNKLTFVRKSGQLPYLRPDGKSQVAVRYVDDKPVALENVIIAAQHDTEVNMDQLREDIEKYVINPVCSKFIIPDTEFFINATGRFEVGGPEGDAGLTGRKIIVDTYGGQGRHGGGAFSGKDPSKVDRSGAYAARFIAKNLVASGLVDKCEVQLAYVIGKAEPTSVNINPFLDGKMPEKKLVKFKEKLAKIVRKEFPLKPADIINHLDLKRPIYADTAAYGHFGRIGFPWEDTTLANKLKKYL